MSKAERRRLLSKDDKKPYTFQISQVLPQKEAFRTTPARWYILFAFCYMGLTQGSIGNAWGPIAAVMKKEFGLSDQRTSLLAMWMSVMFVPGALLFPWIMSWTNMRTVIISNTTLIALAGLVRILSVTIIPLEYLVYSAHVSQIINGFCGAVPFCGIMYIAVTWFPVNERPIAMGFVNASLNTGVAISFVLGPSLIPEYSSDMGMKFEQSHSSDSNTEHESFYVHRLRCYLLIQGIAMFLPLLLVLVYFPSRPRYAPAAKAVTVRPHIKQGLIILMSRGNFWLIVFAYALTSGVYNGYSLTLDIILQNSGISQSTAGYIGFCALLASVVANILIGMLGSIFARHQKALTVGFLSFGTLCITIFVAQIQGFIPRSMLVIWVADIVGVMSITGVAPLLFVMNTQLSQLVGEELCNTVMVLVNQLMCDLFTAVIQIPHLLNDNQKDRLNYLLLACFTISVGLTSLYRPPKVRQLADNTGSKAVTHLDE